MSSFTHLSSIDPRHRDWRPLRPLQPRRQPPIANPVVEPFWSGTRVLAHFAARPDSDEPATLEFVDEEGEPVSDRVPEVAQAVRRSVMALEAVIDGVLSSQATAGGVGAVSAPDVRPEGMSLFLPRRREAGVGQPVSRRAKVGASSDAPLAFVAVDLLSVDGQSLLDLPLLERKRQLESLFMESALVRVSPMAQPPVGPWLNSWRGAGFRGVMMKGANSRYRPGEQTVEWAVVDKVHR